MNEGQEADPVVVELLTKWEEEIQEVESKLDRLPNTIHHLLRRGVLWEELLVYVRMRKAVNESIKMVQRII